MAADPPPALESLAAALSLAQVQYTRLLASHPDGMVVLNGSGLVVYANAAAQQMLAATLQDLLLRPWPLSGTLLRPVDVIATSGQRRLQLRREQIIWEGTAATLLVLHDGTQQNASSILQSLADSLQATVLQFDRTLHCCFVTPNVAASLALAPVAVLGRTCHELNLNPRVAARWEHALLAVFGTGQVRQVDFEYPTLDAHNVYETRFVPELDYDGAINTVLVVMQDTTRRRQLERDLHESQRFAQQLADSLPGLVYIYDLADDRHIYTNAAFSSLLGYASDKLRETGLVVNGTLMHPEDVARWLAEIMPQYATVAAGGFIETEFRMRHADGRWCWFLGREVVWRRSPDGAPEQVLGIAQDITIRKAIEGALADERSSLARRVAERTAELSAANLELAHAARLKDEFLANMSHELRTPLQAILGLTENLEQGMAGPLTDKQVRYVQIVLESGQHLLSLINDILEFSRIESGRFEANLGPTTANRICDSSLRMVREQAIRKGLTVNIQIDEQLGNIQADERMLKQVLINLLGNAAKFTASGGRIGLEVTGDRARSVLHFAIWDTGIGIAEQDFGRLFRPFVQLEAGLNRQYAGTGLGLALVSRLVRLHNGTVAVESTRGAGSRFTVTIPWEPLGSSGAVIHTGSDSMKSAVAQRSLQRLRSAGRRIPSVLLVTDAAMSSAALTVAFANEGCAVTTTSSGQEGLMLVRQLDPQLTLIDIHVPDIDSIEAAQRLRADPMMAERPVVAISSQMLPGARDRLLAAGYVDVLYLPLTKDEVGRLCRSYCGVSG